MFGAQQNSAYKTIMKTPQHMPRRSESDSRLFGRISWRAVIVLAAFVAGIVAANIAALEVSANPFFLIVIPMSLVLLFCWWLIDVAPKLSRWLIATLSFLFSFGCLVIVWILPAWEQLQLAALFVYSIAVSREAWRQLRVAKDDETAEL